MDRSCSTRFPLYATFMLEIITMSSGWCVLVTLGGRKKMKSHFGRLDFPSSEIVWAEQLSSKIIIFTLPSVWRWYGQKTLRIHHSVIFCSNQAFVWFLYWRGGLAPSISFKHSVFYFISQRQQVALFSTGRCAHHGCNMSLIFHLLHTRIILFFASST